MKINEKNLIAYSTTRDHIDKEGYLHKRGEVNKAFQRRWFVLKGNLLFYFEKKGDKEPLGVVILEGCTTELAESEEYYVFKLNFYGPNSRVYELSAESQEDLEAWMKCISRSSYDYLKLMVAELQKQLEEIEESENSSCIRNVLPPISVCGLPTTGYQQRENPFNRSDEMTFSELWNCNESLNNVSSLLAKSASSRGAIHVNPSLPLSVPFRPAPPPPVVRPPSSKIIVKGKQFLVLHQEYGEIILKDRANYTSNLLRSGLNNVDHFDKVLDKENINKNIENLIDL